MKPAIEALFFRHFGTENRQSLRHFFAPGRVNLIGEHLDYNGGLVLPAAINRGIHAVIRQREERCWGLISGNHPDRVEIPLDPIPGPGQIHGWGNHVAGVLALHAESGLSLPGAEVLLSSDLPEGSGLSSSAALEMIFAWMTTSLSGKTPDKTRLALLAQSVESRYLGVQCGIMDPYAIAHGVSGRALLVDCSKLTHREIPAELSGYRWVILDSRKPRELAGSAYNDRRLACEKAAGLLGLDKLAMINQPEMPGQLADPALQAVARHVYSESQRVLAAAASLETGNPVELGNLLKASHASLRDDFAVSCLEMDILVDAANSYPGCCGARMTGAGFGGCAVALVLEKQISSFTSQVAEVYKTATGIDPGIFPISISSGVGELT